MKSEHNRHISILVGSTSQERGKKHIQMWNTSYLKLFKKKNKTLRMASFILYRVTGSALWRRDGNKVAEIWNVLVNHRNISGHISQEEKKASERPWGKNMSPKGPERGAQEGEGKEVRSERSGSWPCRTLTLLIWLTCKAMEALWAKKWHDLTYTNEGKWGAERTWRSVRRLLPVTQIRDAGDMDDRGSGGRSGFSPPPASPSTWAPHS